MAQYTPKFSDPRILATTKRALSFVALYTKASHQAWISRNQIYKHLGNTSRPLGRYLKEHLLIEADKYYNSETGICKKYKRNDAGIAIIKQQAGLMDFIPALDPKLEEQLSTGEFEYVDKSDRIFNPIQFLPKQIRGPLLANHGYTYYYDIEAAAPNLLIQLAQRHDPSLCLDNLKNYITNRSQVREDIALATGLTTSQVKTVINGILQGGVISSWQRNQLFQELNYSHDAVIRLNHNDSLRGIKQDISKLWKTLRVEFPVRYLTDVNGKLRKKRLNGKDKSGLYRQLESEVGVVIRRLLKSKKIQALWIHDGWCCDRFIDPSDVELKVKRATGYSIRLEWNKYEDV